MSERIVIKSEYQKDIQAYIDYCRIVGSDDGGKMMSEKEFEAYKKKVAEARKNHLYVYWTNLKDMDCKAIGPESMCFCGHRYKMHNFDNVKTKKVTCKDTKCKCPLFNYIPVHGSNDIKCLCKHSFRDHNVTSRKCTKSKCSCVEFGSKFTCNCTFTYDDHTTTIETREERLGRGKQVDPSWMQGELTAGMGGLNSFGGMVGDVYELEYNKLLNAPEKVNELMYDFDGKVNQINSSNIKSISNGEDNQVSKIAKSKTGVSALELFNMPNKYAKKEKNSDIKKSFKKLSLK